MLRKIFNSTKALYSPEFPRTIAYMMQSTDYRIWPYLKWFWTTDDFSKVRNRRQLDQTLVAKLILYKLEAGIALEIAGGILLMFLTIGGIVPAGWAYGLAAIIAYPVVWSHLVCAPVALARLVVIEPKEKKAISKTKQIFATQRGLKIAIAGSYGKTSLKELLLGVLSQGKEVAATPANKNVAMSHLKFAQSLSGQEDILIVEFGEGGPGDVYRFSDTLKPDMAVITGLAPAHLDRYKTMPKAAEDIFSLAKFVKASNLYVNKESEVALAYIKPGYRTYDRSGALGWQVKNVNSSINGLKFKLVKGSHSLSLNSALVGRHQIGPLALVAALAKELGLSDRQIEEGIKQTKPYEHRLQPYLLSGAWVIDDTYNGNLEGIKAGTALLGELEAKRKIYVTPGLVDQGNQTDKIHFRVGQLIAAARPDVVVLMANSVTKYIKNGLNKADFKGEVRIENDPLNFYTNLASFIASGDLILMQNDWTDNYR